MNIGHKLPAWGKSAQENKHHLAHHCADVAAVMVALLSRSTYRRRAEAACGHPLTDAQIACLAALAFLHDIGKLAPGFQAKGRPEIANVEHRGHLEAGWLWTRSNRQGALAGAITYLANFPKIDLWLTVIFAHHGRPTACPTAGLVASAYFLHPSYDWEAEETVIGQALVAWFPEIRSHIPPDPTPVFSHFFAGLLTLADWIGSDRDAFPFEPDFYTDYWLTARRQANERIAALGLTAAGLYLKGEPSWGLVSAHPAPRAAQSAAANIPSTERLLLLEAETGSGKTEAALWRFAALVAAGEVDALYFAVPTRAAARQLFRRVNETMQRMFVNPPEAVLAIPGQAMAGEAALQKLPDFSVLWDDQQRRPARWAAEHSARFLAARIAVGTVDQITLGALQVKFAHLRGATLSRSLLVIDEVHASDAYMTEVQHAMVSDHLRLGGHVILMSATLGAKARRKWLGQADASFEADIAVPYPAVWTRRGPAAIPTDENARKDVHVGVARGWSGAEAAALARRSAEKDARVLVIRNTVDMAQATFLACRDAAPNLLLDVDGTPTLHHGRFAAEDRARLDRAVERCIGKDSPLGGRIVIGSQTLEQSLDLCADLLITDLCPMDVLLQRIGRLHRHRRARPAGFEAARVIVLTPKGGLDPLTRRPENGLGANPDGPSFGGIYVDVPGLAATLAEIETRPLWQIPAMNRGLVEAATHPEAVDRAASANGWQDYHQRVVGRSLAHARAAGLVLLDREKPIAMFPTEDAIRTRLGEEGVVLTLPTGTIGAFGQPIRTLALPAHWSRGLSGDEVSTVIAGMPLNIELGGLSMTYGPEGLTREGSTKS
ncbi:MAG: CRISPR-associated helicase Cas3' [Caulobacteraceae bacterium]|nr:CRISPR-associated helicase Cas3' [Caulobacteraceae bacterium]